MIERQVRDVHLADLGNQHEPFPRDLQRIRKLDVASQNQHEHVARAELVVGGHGSRKQRHELGGGPPKHIDPEHAAPALPALAAPGADQPGVDRQRVDAHRDRLEAERLDGRQLLHARRRCPLAEWRG